MNTDLFIERFGNSREQTQALVSAADVNTTNIYIWFILRLWGETLYTNIKLLMFPLSRIGQHAVFCSSEHTAYGFTLMVRICRIPPPNRFCSKDFSGISENHIIMVQY